MLALGAHHLLHGDAGAQRDARAHLHAVDELGHVLAGRQDAVPGRGEIGGGPVEVGVDLEPRGAAEPVAVHVFEAHFAPVAVLIDAVGRDFGRIGGEGDHRRRIGRRAGGKLDLDGLA